MAALNPFKKFAALGKTAGVASKTARSTGLVVAVPRGGASSVIRAVPARDHVPTVEWAARPACRRSRRQKPPAVLPNAANFLKGLRAAMSSLLS